MHGALTTSGNIQRRWVDDPWRIMGYKVPCITNFGFSRPVRVLNFLMPLITSSSHPLLVRIILPCLERLVD